MQSRKYFLKLQILYFEANRCYGKTNQLLV